MATPQQSIIEDNADANTQATATNVATATGIGAAAGAAGVSSAGAAAGGGVAGAQAGAASTLAAMWPLAIIIAAWTNYNNYKKAKKQLGTNVTQEEAGALIDPVGSSMQGAISELGEDPINPQVVFGKIFGSGKHEDQIVRDRWRVNLEKMGMAVKGTNGSHHVELADGTVFDVGIDGHNTWTGLDGQELRPYNADFSNPLTQQTIGFTNPLAVLMAGGDEKLTNDGAGYLTNAALSNATSIEGAQANARHFYEQAFGQAAAQNGVSVEEAALGSLQVLYDMGKLTEEQFIAYSNGVRQTFGHAPLTPPGTPVEQDPAQPEGVTSGDPDQGFSNNTATAGVVLDDEIGTNTMGDPSDDVMPSVGDPNNGVPDTKTQLRMMEQPIDQSVQTPQRGVAQPQQVPVSVPNTTGIAQPQQVAQPASTQLPQALTGQIPPLEQGQVQGTQVPDTAQQVGVPDTARAGNVSKEDAGVGEFPASTVSGNNRSPQGLTFEQQSALLNQQFIQNKALQDEALGHASEANAKSFLGSLAASEMAKQRTLLGQAPQRGGRGNMGTNIATILGG